MTENYEIIQNGHLNGWLVKNPDSNKIILFCHGTGGNISYNKKIIPLRKIGINILIFDYSGYGESSGIPSETQFYHDADSIMDLLLNNYNYKTNDIIAYGESLGGPVACYIAQKYDLPILILDSPLPSVNSLAKRILKTFHIGNILSSILTYPFYEFNTEINLENYTGKSSCSVYRSCLISGTSCLLIATFFLIPSNHF